MARRLKLWLLQLLIAIDQLGHVLLGGPKFVLLGGRCPSADETISSKVGRAALRGKRWALLAEAAIDGVFVLLGGAAGHCRDSIEEECRWR